MIGWEQGREESGEKTGTGWAIADFRLANEGDRRMVEPRRVAGRRTVGAVASPIETPESDGFAVSKVGLIDPKLALIDLKLALIGAIKPIAFTLDCPIPPGQPLARPAPAAIFPKPPLGLNGQFAFASPPSLLGAPATTASKLAGYAGCRFNCERARALRAISAKPPSCPS